MRRSRCSPGLATASQSSPPSDGGRPLCCGRTFLSAGLVEEARAEARRLLAAAVPLAARGVPVVGLEPSCLLTLRDELGAMLPGAEADLLASRAVLFEEFLAGEAAAGRIPASIAEREGKVLLHGHCHQKAFGAMDAVRGALALCKGLSVETVDSSCCGMAGAFGYAAETYDISLRMGELALLPAVRQAPAEAVIAADGFSCRHQIAARHRPARTACCANSVRGDARSAPCGTTGGWWGLSPGLKVAVWTNVHYRNTTETVDASARGR